MINIKQYKGIYGRGFFYSNTISELRVGNTDTHAEYYNNIGYYFRLNNTHSFSRLAYFKYYNIDGLRVRDTGDEIYWYIYSL